VYTFYLWAYSYRDIRVIGSLFVVNAIAALLGLALAVGTFGAFILTVTVSLFGFRAG
jgi:hypothetical protein